MLIYANTFENIKTIDCNFPEEDKFYANNNTAIVVDGITRDPTAIYKLSKLTKEEIIKLPKHPSGAELAANTIVDTFYKSEGTLLNKFIECNKAVKELNKLYIPECDYLENDYYGAVASCINIKENKLHYAYICDCGVIVYDKIGNIKFQTIDDKVKYSNPYTKDLGSWKLPETRINIRKNYRNKPDNIINNQCVSYGALTGEEEAISFIRTGIINIDEGDIIIVYSDGMINFLNNPDFINLIINFDKIKLENYINKLSIIDYEKYGKEKTLVVIKV